jgi:hypothetical protein
MTTDITSPTPPAPRPYRRRGMFWPLVLIGIGIIALLANYGLIQSVSVLSILALWPVLLILLGIDIAFARRWPLPTLAAEVVIIGAALFLAAARPAALSFGTFTFNSCPNPTLSSSVARGTLDRLTLRVDAGGSRFRIVGGSANAVEVSSDQQELCVSDRTTGSAGDVRISQGGRVQLGGSSEIVAKVANDLPLSLTVNAGAGEFLVDLHDVKTKDARLSIGASNTTIVLPHPTGDVAIRLDGGASSVVIEIPVDVEARVIVTGGLISTSSTNPRATKSGNITETPGYGTAKDRVTVSITGGVSSISIR